MIYSLFFFMKLQRIYELRRVMPFQSFEGFVLHASTFLNVLIKRSNIQQVVMAIEEPRSHFVRSSELYFD